MPGRLPHSAAPPVKRVAGAATAAVASALLMAGCVVDAGGGQPRADPSLVLPMAVGLPRDPAGLADAVADVSDPASPNFGRWLTPATIRASFAGPDDAADRTLAQLRAAGFIGDIDPTGSIIIGSITAGDAERLLGTPINVVAAGDDIEVARPAHEPRLPRAIAANTREIVGLTLQLGVDTLPPTAPNPVACPTPGDLGDALGARYGLTGVTPNLTGGSGVRMALLGTDAISARAMSLVDDCTGGTVPPVRQIDVDDSAARVFGPTSVESTLDVAAASLLARSLAGIDVYVFNPYSPMVFALAAAIDASYAPDGPTLISTSIGLCEPDVSAAQRDLAEWLLMSAAGTGATVVASAGDDGSSACAPRSTAPAAQFPSSSGYVTAVGGTEFTDGGARGEEQVWNSGRQAGGGSTASREPRPFYQRGLPDGDQRVVPDVAYIAAPGALGPIPVCDLADVCSLARIGGTSATAPAFAAALADISAALPDSAGRPSRLGLVNPTIYAAATQAGGGPFTLDITAGDNDLYDVGCCTAAVGYDSASGWGAVRFDALLARYRVQLPR